MTAAELVAKIEAVRTELAAARDAIEELAIEAEAKNLHHGQALEAAAGGITCVIATLHAGQQNLEGTDG